nr:hypothetical protein [Tanacetum cinerariifolium]
DSEEELSWKSFEDEEVGGQEEGNESNDDSDDGSDKDSEETVKSRASVEDTHVILTPVNPDDQQESSSMSSFVSSMQILMSKGGDEGVESIFATTSSQSVSLVPPTPILTPST